MIPQTDASLFVGLIIAYFVVWLALAAGTWLFFRKKSAELKWRWSPRAALLNGVIVGTYLVVLATLGAGWLVGALFAGVLAMFVYVNVARTSICHRCGKGRDIFIFRSPGFCGRCGTQLRPPAPLWDRPERGA